MIWESSKKQIQFYPYNFAGIFLITDTSCLLKISLERLKELIDFQIQISGS